MTDPNNRARILVVDDDPDTRAIVGHFLNGWGYEVEHADNGRLALERVAESPPELVLLDLEMPEMDGFETCARLKSNPDTESIPVVIFTGLEELPQKRVRKIEESADDYIVKSAEPEELRARIASVLARSRKVARLQALAPSPQPTASETLSLSETPFPDAIQIALAYRRDGVVELRDDHEPPNEGRVVLRDGAIVHAVCGDARGEEAFYGFALWTRGHFDFSEATVGTERSIETPTRSLLVESSRRGDAWRRISSKVPSFDLVPVCVPLVGASSIRLSRSDWAVVRHADGRRSIAGIVEVIGTDLFEAGRVVYSLVTVGVLRLDPPPIDRDPRLELVPRRGSALAVEEPFEITAREWDLLIAIDGTRTLDSIRLVLDMSVEEAGATMDELRRRGFVA